MLYFTSDELGFTTFQTFKSFNQEYSDSFVRAARLIYSFTVSAGTMLRLQVPVFSVYYYCLLKSKNNLCAFHMKTFLSSPFCVIIQSWHATTSPVNDYNIGIKHGFSCINVCQVPREVLKTEAEGRGFQHLPRDLANVNVLENNV